MVGKLVNPLQTLQASLKSVTALASSAGKLVRLEHLFQAPLKVVTFAVLITGNEVSELQLYQVWKNELLSVLPEKSKAGKDVKLEQLNHALWKF